MKKRGSMRTLIFFLFCCICILYSVLHGFYKMILYWVFNFLKSTSQLSLTDLFITALMLSLHRDVSAETWTESFPRQISSRFTSTWILHHGYVPDKIIFPSCFYCPFPELSWVHQSLPRRQTTVTYSKEFLQWWIARKVPVWQRLKAVKFLMASLVFHLLPGDPGMSAR